MLQFGVAKELGKSLREIRDMTLDELIGWSAYFQIVNEEQERNTKKLVELDNFLEYYRMKDIIGFL